MIKDKFGNELTFILPSWVNENPEDIDNNTHADIAFREHLYTAEKTYFTLLKEGWKPQQARQVLPNALKTELVMTGFVSDWKYLFNLRTSSLAMTGKPHPDMSNLCDPLYEEFTKRGLIF